LVCVVTSRVPGEEPWVKWIEIRPLAPGDYLDAQVEYDFAQQRVRATVAPRPGLDLIPLGIAEEKRSLAVFWDTSDPLYLGVERNDLDQISSNSDAARLFATVPPDPKRAARVRLAADGYPRAFVREVDLIPGGAERDVRGQLGDVRIVSISLPVDKQLLEFRTVAPAAPLPPPADGRQRVLEVLGPSGVALFPVGDERQPLRVEFQVDAPPDAFSVRDRNSRVEIGFEGLEPRRFHADRQIRTLLGDLSSDGFSLTTQVSDFVIDLETQGLKDSRLQLAAVLALPSGSLPPHRVEVVLDSTPPRLDRFEEAAGVVRQGEKLQALFEVYDLSGLRKAELGLVAQRDEDLKPEQCVIKDDFGKAAVDGRARFTMALDTKLFAPRGYQLKLKLTDAVGKVLTRVLQSVTVQPPPEMKTDQPGDMPVEGTLKGLAVFGSGQFKPRGLKVELKDSDQAPTETDGEGGFQFEKVGPGKYTLEIKGFVSNKPVEGKREIEIKAQKDFAQTYRVTVK
jgi:hypothetical protein